MPTSGNSTMASRSINVEPPRPPSSKQKPPRLRSACNQCYAAKVKCTGERAGCARCRTLDAECIYLESRVGKVQGSRSKRRRLELQQEQQQQQQQQQPRQQVAVVDQTVERDSIQALGFSADETISQSPQQRRLAPSQPQSQTKSCNTDQQNLFSWNQPWGPPSTAQWPYDDVQILNGTLPSLDDMILNGETADNNTNSNCCSNDNGHQRLPIDTNPGFELDFMNGDPPSPNMSRSGSSSSSRSSSSGDSPSRESTPAPSNNGVPGPTLLSPTSTAITTTIMSQPTTATSGENILPTPRSTRSEQPRHQVNQHTGTAPRQMPIQHGVLSVSDNSSTHSPMPRSSASSSSPMSNLGRSRPSQQPQRPNSTNNSKLNSRVILASVQILATLETYILADLRALDLILETCRKTLAQMKHLIGLFHAEPWCCPNERCFLLLTAIISQVIQLLRSDAGYSLSSTDGVTTTTATTGDYRDSNRRHGSEDTNNSPSASRVDSDSIFSANSSSAFNQLPLFGFGFGGGAFSLTVEEQTLWRSRVMRKEYRRVGEVLSSLRVLLASGGEKGTTRGKNKNSEPFLGSLEQELKSLYEMERNKEDESIQKQRHEGTKMISMMNDHGDDDGNGGDGGDGGLLSPFSTVSGRHPLFGS